MIYASPPYGYCRGKAHLWSAPAMLALLLSQAVHGIEQGRSMASFSQGGGMAPALHMVGAQIPDVSRRY
jgi:hypothetical protein